MNCELFLAAEQCKRTRISSECCYTINRMRVVMYQEIDFVAV